MTYVYTISVYDEHGSDDVRATLVRAAVPAMLDRAIAAEWATVPDWVKTDQQVSDHAARRAAITAEAQQGLAACLARADEDLAFTQKFGLTRGWGGHQLHVVKLEESK